MLRKAGAKVTIAENGQDAIEAVRTAQAGGKPFDIIIMDMQMPVLDGMAATRQIRSIGFSDPIIALTARNGLNDREQCTAAGCDAFLSKPFTRFELIRLLATHLKRSRTKQHPLQN